MKNKEIPVKNAVQMVRSEILRLEKDGGASLSEEDISGIIAKEIKRRREVLPDYQKSGNLNRVGEINLEILHLSKYLPEQLSEEQVEEAVLNAIAEVGAKSPGDMGKVMAAVLPRLKGRADGGVISGIVRKKLG